jgi:hypothetical protein
MWSPRHVLVTIFLCLLAGSALVGCRAFEPEAIVVNRPPETYIIGSPAETSGAYFHFHVYWYGADEDGTVERFVWALTDTSIQDPETDDDEEDLRFNPATNISTLEIGRYTTRTDSVFDFQIGQGALRSYDMTLHMVAIDDRGDFDRTPARLHFFSNALGNPRVEFYRGEVAPGNEFANLDTVAFGNPLFLKWSGSTPNIEAYNPDLLAQRDTVPPSTDGLLGFKWRLPEFSDCNDAEEDCWNPRAFDEASGDSFSFFGPITELTFLNDGSGSGVFGRVLEAQTINLLVNTIDVAGVEVPATDQLMEIVINYDPDTRFLRGESDPVGGHNDDAVYPYYILRHGPLAGPPDNPTRYTFSEGDTVPDGAYVVFKAIGWDDPRDNIVDPDEGISFQGQFIAGDNIRGEGIYFEFSTSYSAPHQTREWTATDPEFFDNPWDNPSADTLGFEVGPFNYAVVMRAVDEQGTRDGTPDTFRFVGNYPPCVQCIELGNTAFDPQSVYEDPCENPGCLEDTTELTIYSVSPPNPGYDPTDPTHLGTIFGDANPRIWVQPNSGAIAYEEPVQPADWAEIPAIWYYYVVYLSGRDGLQEYWPDGQAQQRIAAWRYQIDYAADGTNAISDGGGADNINSLSGFDVATNQPDPNVSDLFIDPNTGVWGIRVRIAVPQLLMLAGPVAYWNGTLLPLFGEAPADPGWTEEELLEWQQRPGVQTAYRAWRLTLMPFGDATVRAIAADQSTCTWRVQTNTYHYYQGTRIPTPNGRRCEDGAYNTPEIVEQGAIDLEDFITYSNTAEDAVTKNFRITLYPTSAPNPDPVTADQDPPGWIPTDKRLTLR